MLDKRQSQDALHSICPHAPGIRQQWCPYLKQDIQAIERVQRRATKMVHELKYLKYTERLKKLGLTTLEARRQRGDSTPSLPTMLTISAGTIRTPLPTHLLQADQRVAPKNKRPTHKELSNHIELFHQQNRQPLERSPVRSHLGTQCQCV